MIGEELEARGLTGRIYKQLYINDNDPTSTRNRTNLARAERIPPRLPAQPL
jgi:hypothetical protein